MKDDSGQTAQDKWAAIIEPRLRRFAIGTFLVAAFVVTGAVLLFIITAVQLQSAVNAPEFASLQVSTGWMRQDVTALESYWKTTNAIMDKESEAQAALYKAGAHLDEAREAMRASSEAVRNFIDTSDTAYILPPLRLRPFPPPMEVPDNPAPDSGASQDVAAQTGATPGATTVAAPQSAGATVDKSGADEGFGTWVSPAVATAAAFSEDARPPVTLRFGKAVEEYFDSYYSLLGNALATDPARQSLNKFKDEVYARMKPYYVAHADYDAARNAIATQRTQITALEAESRQLDQNIQRKGTPLANGSYWSLTEDLLAFKNQVGDFAYNIVALPRMMLVLILSIFMGVLGSLIYLSKDFLARPDAHGFWAIVFRICLGACVAFALFFFAAAGMLALSQGPAGGGEQADMSPYLISFLGITGGYLSDHVTDWMRQVGENAFKVERRDRPARWAVGLDAALRAAGLDGAALAAACDVDAADVSQWIALKKPVPGDKQALVAAFLRTHPSHLFTDIAPEGASAAMQPMLAE